MLARKAFMRALLYVPLNQINPQLVMDQLRVRYVKKDEADINQEDNYEEEKTVDAGNIEIECFDMSIPGYIGVPRSYGIEKLGISKFVNLTTYKSPTPSLFLKKIKPRDKDQQDFIDALCGLVRSPKPVDIVANARTGTGKTVAAIAVVDFAIQAPTLITVPTVYLLNQWRDRIRSLTSPEWFDRYVGHIQQNKTDYEGRLIVIGVSASLARRDYPLALREYFTAIIFDEWHKIGTPSMGRILSRYPASVRIGLTATNRRDALLKVCTLHLGKPRVISKQEVMHPLVYVIDYRRTLPPRMRVQSEGHMTTILSRLKDRNQILVNVVLDGYNRGKEIVCLSDRTAQLLGIMDTLIERGVDPADIGMLVGSYVGRDGKRIKLKKEEQERVAGTCKIRMATFGLFDTGADVEKLNMGVEFTPRQNVRQGVGRILRISPGKDAPEWYSIRDEIMVYPDIDDSAPLFGPKEPYEYPWLMRAAKGREASYRDQKGTVFSISANDFIEA